MGAFGHTGELGFRENICIYWTACGGSEIWIFMRNFKEWNCEKCWHLLGSLHIRDLNIYEKL
jgi:hypothetical protein